ncbi:MAG: transposase [Ignavibacteria bacterium]|nr:transposase [Ignavibacteria bacterium]
MLNPIYNVADIMKNIKGESSHWVNQNRFIDAKFSWQKSYDAVSVSESMLEFVDRFISNQKEYHMKITFPEERALILKKFINHPDNKTV